MSGYLIKSCLNKMLLIVILFVTGTYYAYAYGEELKSKPDLILSDTAMNSPVLKTMFDSGFFSGNNYSAQYIPEFDINNKQNNSKYDFTLIGSIKTHNDIEQSSFNIFLIDSLRRNILIGWEVPRDDKFRRDSSIRTMIEFAKTTRESTIPDALINTPGFIKTIEKVTVSYKDDNAAEVSAYDLTVHTGFSRTHRFIRTLSELCLMTSVGMANYWINKDANMEDWRYKYRWKDVWPRFRDGWSFDTNAYRTNTVYHLYAGAIYYQVARSNEYGILASTAWAFTGSFIWEYIGEWREQSSGNDMVFTSFGGAIVGEAFRQSSIYVEQCMPKNVYATILYFLLDPMRIINRGLDRCFDGNYRVSIVFMNPAAQAIMEKARKN